jgi:hypothetical protein
MMGRGKRKVNERLNMSVTRSIIQYPASRTKRPYTVPVTDADGRLPDGVGYTDSEAIDATLPIQSSGVEISFDVPRAYNTASSPGSGDITDDTTNARFGVIQKIYHQDSVSPVVPGHWITLSGAYSLNDLNIIYAEYVSDTRVEIWITQEAA